MLNYIEETAKTANENELIDELKVATKAKDTNLTDEAHSRSSRKIVFRGRPYCWDPGDKDVLGQEAN